MLSDVMVGVAQLVELRIVIPAVGGSNPLAHPIYWDQIGVYWDQIGVEQAALRWCAWAILASSIQHPASSILRSPDCLLSSGCAA